MERARVQAESFAGQVHGGAERAGGGPEVDRQSDQTVEPDEPDVHGGGARPGDQAAQATQGEVHVLDVRLR